MITSVCLGETLIINEEVELTFIKTQNPNQIILAINTHGWANGKNHEIRLQPPAGGNCVKLEGIRRRSLS